MPAPKIRLKPRKNQFFGRPSCGLSNSAASAGESVSELIAEMTVEMAMVTANWR